VLKRVAVKLSKICNDLRLLSSGPRAGLNEINLPAVQSGSSIMPGKVNPVIPEVVNQVAYEVIGNDVTISFAAEAGQLELNAMEPVIAYNLFRSIDMLCRACRILAENCIDGITANRERCRRMVEDSIGIVTALTFSLCRCLGLLPENWTIHCERIPFTEPTGCSKALPYRPCDKWSITRPLAKWF
jgi:aspartate ammonia-lyase